LGQRAGLPFTPREQRDPGPFVALTI